MRFRTLAVGVAIVAAAAFAPEIAAAAAFPGASKAGTETASTVEHVRHRGHRHRGHRHHHHHHHRHFRRHRHFHYYGGYYDGYGYGHCTRVRHGCADRFGWGSRKFYRCVYSRGC